MVFTRVRVLVSRGHRPGVFRKRGKMSDSEALQPEEATAEAPTAAAAPEAEARPREAVRGIHPELRCHCPECEPEFVELQWFTVDEPRKVKGDAMLFCARSSRKYFVPVLALNAWIAEKGGPRRGRKGEG